MATTAIADVRAHLNITATTDDAELGRMIDSAEAAIVEKCGPLAVETITQRVRGGGVLVVDTTPLLDVTGIVGVNGADVPVTDVTFDDDGVIERLGSGGFPVRWYDVTFTAGRETVPADLAQGVLELIRHMWLTQRGSAPADFGAFPSAGEDDSFSVPAGLAFTFPRRVNQLIMPHVQVDI